MKTDKKDKIIIAMIIVIVILIAKTFNNKNDQVLIEKNNNQVENLLEEESTENTKVKKVKKVHISGEVNKAGVYEIKDGDRLEDLVNMAGGLTQNANIDSINLSMVLEDQMRIIIPNINDKETNIDQNTVVAPKDNTKININTASKEELMSLPNIGEKRADSIIEYRENNRFEKIEDIKNVTGIGDKYYEQMKELIITD
ncbi:MAG: helix-hairpin-helix domain-containing protein [Peptoniphilaceae bacterium]|nr:helix-hairpin-helix domain-containing protein [Peptoniphilaceae bacterium]MDY6019599.1 helix-hairpin-helix domain-containing protein [Anaerococcus sp.]